MTDDPRDDLSALSKKADEPDLPLVYRLLTQLIEEKYRPLLDESSDCMCIADREGKFVYVNKHLADSLGYTKKDLLSQHLSSIVAPESWRTFQERTRAFLKEQRVKLDNFVLVTKYKGRITGEMSAMAFYDNAGKYCGVKAVFKDRTRMIEMERQGRKYETMLEDGIGALDQVILILDRDFKIRWTSVSFKKYFGLERDSILGEDARLLFENRLRVFFKKGDEFLQCEVATSDDGPRFTMEHWSYPITHGDLEGGRIEIFRDVTERKKSEERLEYYHKKIHAIMEHAVEGIVELRTDNTIEFVNASFAAMLGLSEVEMIDKPLTDFIVSDEHMSLVSIKLIRRAREITFLKKDGSWLHTMTSSIPLVFGAQAPHALCFITNITEAKVASFKLRDANLTLRALNASLVDLSHRDARTGVYNQRYLSERLPEEFARAKRYMRPFSLIMADIDFFKMMNDTYGHAFGDAVLHGFVALLKSSVRATDIVIRFGGDEFMAFLPDTDGYGAAIVARKILKALRAQPLGDAVRRTSVSVSVGIVSFPEAGVEDADQFLAAADAAMYQSKARGHNKITVYHRRSASGLIKNGDRPRSRDTTGLLRDLEERLKHISRRNEESILESLRPMVREAYLRAGYPNGVLERVLKNVEALGLSMGVSEHETGIFRKAAFIANLGLLGVPRRILNKPDRLSPDEFSWLRQYPSRSAELIREIPFLQPLIPMVLAHHERYDGEGYPRGLKGEDIPLGARILTLASTYEALRSPRPYRSEPLTEEAALDVIRRESGRQFDPAIVEHFLRLAS
jgi:diguanylate cyclase (GGDEF)-like protein/PAS domain S-box-containing protein